MQEQLSIEELQRLAKGHTALLSAIDKLIRADNDRKLNPGSENFRKAYRNAFNHLKTVANKEFINSKQPQLF